MESDPAARFPARDSLAKLLRDRDWRGAAALIAKLGPAAQDEPHALAATLAQALDAAVQHKDAEAAEALSRLLLASTEGAAGLSFASARFLHLAGCRGAALDCYRRLIAAGDADAVPMAAVILAGLGRFQEALALLAGSPRHRLSDQHLALLCAARRCEAAAELAKERLAASRRTVADYVASTDWLVRSGVPEEALAVIAEAPPAIQADRTIAWYRQLYGLFAARSGIVAERAAPAAGARDLLVSVIAWGSDYAERLGAVTLASLAAPGNLPAFARDRKVTLRIYTDLVGRMILQRAASVQELQQDIAIEYEIIPAGLLEMQGLTMPITPRYLLLGLFAHLSLLEAGRSGRDAMLLGADCIYSSHFCSHLAALAAAGKELISVSVGFSAKDSLLGALAPWRRDCVIDIPSEDLVDLGFAYIHHRTLTLMVDPGRGRRTSMPAMLFFPTEDGLAFRKLGIDLTYIANEAIRRAGALDYQTPDGEMADRLVPPEEWHRIHRVADSRDAILVELIPDAQRFPEVEGERLDPLHVVDYADTYGFLNYMRHCFLHETRLTGRKPPPWPGEDHSDFIERTRRLLFEL